VGIVIADNPEDHVTSPSAVPTAVHNETFTLLQYNPEDNEAEPEPHSHYDKDECSIQQYEIMKVWIQAHIVILDGVWIANWIYWTLLHIERDYTLKSTVTHIH
jgi:hypothetical protein